MEERVVLAILLLICLGQVRACSRGRLSGVIYYVCVAPMAYFSVWTFGTWEPQVLCGVVLIAWPFLERWCRESNMIPGSHGIFWFVAYTLVATVIASQFWPYEAIAGRSISYGVLRAPVRMIEFVIMLGVAWRIGEALREPGAFRQARAAWLVMAVLLCSYGVYQWKAYEWSLPVTGIRRPANDVTAESGGEQFAAYQFGDSDEYVFRICSLVGEPKHLGGLCVFWICLVAAELLDRERRRIIRAAAFLIPITLWLTASTSAWASAALSVCLCGYVLLKSNRFGVGRFLLPLTIIIGMVILVPILPQERLQQIDNVLQMRFVQRIENPFADLPEMLTKEVFYQNPHLMLTGVGLGGISFYIAEKSGGSDVVLFPNNGVLGLLSDYGLLGILLLLNAMRPGLQVLLSNYDFKDKESVSLATVALGVLIQCLIFPGQLLWSLAIGFSLAAELRRKSHCPIPTAAPAPHGVKPEVPRQHRLAGAAPEWLGRTGR